MEWRYKHTVLTLCTLAFFATMVARLAISPVVPEIREAFSVPNSAVGLALTGLWMAYSLSQFPSGVLADRFGERRVIVVALGGTAVGSLLVAFSPHFAVFFLCTILLGAAAGLHYSVATTLLARTYDDIGTAIGIHTGGAPAAGLITPILVAGIASGIGLGWRAGVAVGAAVALPTFVVFALFVRPTEPRRPDQPMAERFEIESVRELLTRPPIAFTVCLAIASAFVWQGISSFLPMFLVEHRDQSTTVAGIVFSGYFVVQGITQVGVGAFSDRYGRDLAIGGCMVLAAVGLALFAFVEGIVAVVLAVVLAGTGLSWAAAVLPRFMDELTEREQNAGFGLVRTTYGVIGALGSFVTGLVADFAGWTVSFGLLIAMVSLVALAVTANWLFDWGY